MSYYMTTLYQYRYGRLFRPFFALPYHSVFALLQVRRNNVGLAAKIGLAT